VPPLRSISARKFLQTPMGARQTSLLLEGKGQFPYSMEDFRKWFTRFHIPSSNLTITWIIFTYRAYLIRKRTGAKRKKRSKQGPWRWCFAFQSCACYLRVSSVASQHNDWWVPGKWSCENRIDWNDGAIASGSEPARRVPILTIHCPYSKL
jgi:hypothetical protein